MHSFRPSLLKVLLLVIVASLFSSVIASAAPIADDDFYGCVTKVQPGVQGGGCCNYKQAYKFASSSTEGRGCCQQQAPKLASSSVEGGGCCQQQNPKVASSFVGGYGCCNQQNGKIASSVNYGCCQQGAKIASSYVGGYGCCKHQDNKIASSFSGEGGYGNHCCSQQPLKIASQVNGGKGYQRPPCEPPAPAPTCSLDMPTGSVVGNLPFNTQADYAAGLIATDVTINAGTYWVTGVAKAANGDPFYRIIVACQYLYVPVGSMQPSFEAPWNGEPLPTNEVP